MSSSLANISCVVVTVDDIDMWRSYCSNTVMTMTTQRCHLFGRLGTNWHRLIGLVIVNLACISYNHSLSTREGIIQGERIQGQNEDRMLSNYMYGCALVCLKWIEMSFVKCFTYLWSVICDDVWCFLQVWSASFVYEWRVCCGELYLLSFCSFCGCYWFCFPFRNGLPSESICLISMKCEFQCPVYRAWISSFIREVGITWRLGICCSCVLQLRHLRTIRSSLTTNVAKDVGTCRSLWEVGLTTATVYIVYGVSVC